MFYTSWLRAACVTALVLAPFGDACAAEKVTIGNSSYAVADVLSNILKSLVEKNYGLQVDPIAAKGAVAWKAMSDGQGAVDARVDIWLPNSQGFVDQYVTKAGTVALAGPITDARQGFCVTKAMHDKYGVKSVFDLARPEVAHLTDPQNTGKGEIWLGAPDFNNVPIDQVRARDYGLADLYSLTTTSEDVEMTKIVQAIKDGKGVIWSCDSTNYVFTTGQVVMLDEPPYDANKWKMVDPSEAGWLEKSKIAVGWEPIKSYIAYSKRLEKATPQVVALFNRVKFTQSAASEWSEAVYVAKKDPAQVANDWIAAHPADVKSWLGM
jgi:glycine betaine/proline transport system substrate-binding protein